MSAGAERTSLARLFAGFGVPAPDLEVSGLALDSRRVTPGDVFLALRGRAGHGLDHLELALERGAVAVAWEPAPGIAAPDLELPQCAVPGLSSLVGEIAARFHGHPSAALYTAGVTGTDGKTSIAHLLAQALEYLGEPCLYIGTVGSGRLAALTAATHTTPDPVSLQTLLAEARDVGLRAVAMEVSSHALDQGRVAGLDFDAVILSNVQRDHLDYHGTLEAYAAAKRRLFAAPGTGLRILNRDDASGARWRVELAAAGVAPELLLAYGLDGGRPAQGPYLIGRGLALNATGLDLDIDSSWGALRLRTRLLGRFNAYNLLAVAAALLGKGHAPVAVEAALAALRTVPGRIEGFRSQGPLVVVDYAHTPQALRQVLAALRAHCAGQLVCVFGCGGDRDRGKRPLMGAAAAAGADRLLITDDNPRSEDPSSIIAAIVAGVPPGTNYRIQHDRARAIDEAIASAGPGDVVLVAGKGHEDYQIHGAERRPFSDRAYVAQRLGLEAP